MLKCQLILKKNSNLIVNCFEKKPVLTSAKLRVGFSFRDGHLLVIKPTGLLFEAIYGITGI